MDERSKRLFVHYGSKHFDKERFVEARNGLILKQKPDGGLWGSPVHSKYSWINWCKKNKFKNYELDDCFYFRLNTPCNWITIHNKKEFDALPKRTDIQNGFVAIDFEMVMKEGIGDGFPLYAMETVFDDYDEYSDCLLGYDCDSVIVLNDSILIENYDAKISKNPLTLEDLLPIHYFKEIRESISVSSLLRTPDNKVYVYVEESDVHRGFNTLVACISDGRIVELCGYTEVEALEIIDEIKQYKEELEHILISKRVL